jgi:tetratricopeptide (TPR) repeat protein
MNGSLKRHLLVAGVHIGGGAVNTSGGDIVGGNKTIGLNEDAVIALLEGNGYLGGLPLIVARNIVEKFGERTGGLDAQYLERILNEKAEEYRALKGRLQRLAESDADVEALRRESSQLLDKGDFDSADSRLAEAEARALASAVEHEAVARTKRHSAAESRGARGDAAVLRLAYREAASHFEAAASILDAIGDARGMWQWKVRQAEALISEGDDFADRGALHSARNLLEGLLAQEPRDVPIEDIACARSDLGRALLILGARSTGTTRLVNATIHFRKALVDISPETQPWPWSVTHSNLGVALSRLGDRTGELGPLEEAITALAEAIRTHPPDEPVQHLALAKINLGAALVGAGLHEMGTTRLRRGVETYREAARELSRTSDPYKWAVVQGSLGEALVELAKRETGTEHI